MLPLRDRLATRRVPIVNYLLIVLNVAMFLWEQALIEVGVSPTRLITVWGLVPARFLNAPVADAETLLSSMFLHDPSGWFHIGGNMLFLWIFGDNVEDALGSFRYLLLYLLSGLCAAFAQILIDPSSLLPMVGASGAISGVLAAYGSLYPRSAVTVLNPIPLLWFFFGIFLEFPAWIVILEYFVMNLLNGLGSLGTRSGGVAFFAHLGGFVAGLVLVRVLLGKQAVASHEHWQQWRSSRRMRSPMPPTRRGPWQW